ncbi:unnamed protein product [Cochlearia groenlandica]
MAMKMKGIYKGFKCISQIFKSEEIEIEIGYPTDVKHVAHIGWEGSSGCAPDWMSEFKTGAEVLSPRASSYSNARPSTSFFTANSSSSDFDIGSSQRTITDNTQRDIPLITQIKSSKNNNKKYSRRKKSSSSSTSPKSSRSSILSKSSYKSTVSRLI